MSAQKNLFIALEGLSATGKTTVGNLLAEELDAIPYKTPAEILLPVRESVDRAKNPAARFLYYMSGLLMASAEIAKLLQTRSVVCDRYLSSTVCWHSTIGVDTGSVESFVLPLLQKPDFTFLITCKQDLRKMRLQKRGKTFNDEQEENVDSENGFLRRYMERGHIEIDNSHPSDPRVAVRSILSYIRGVS